MALSNSQKNQIKSLLEKKIKEKLKRYEQETTAMPFLIRILQDKEKVAAYSFIHSIATTLGMSVYEGVSEIIARENSDGCSRRKNVDGNITPERKSAIDEIIRKLRNGEIISNHEQEIEKVLRASSERGQSQKKGSLADFYMYRDGKEHYFEIKTAKPNIDVFTESKIKLLEWVARRDKKVRVFLAIPYNPYHPAPYERFTEQGLFDRGKDFLVAEEYWDFLGGKNTFDQLLHVFDETGKALASSIKQKIENVAQNKMIY